MQGWSNLTDVGLCAMGDITSLVSVNLQDCTDITGESDSHLQHHWHCGGAISLIHQMLEVSLAKL